MIILTYNICTFNQKKVDKALQYDADLFILPELACPSMVTLPEDYHIKWTGDILKKGLGVIWKPTLKVEIPGWFNPDLNYFMPLIIDKLMILAAWPTMTMKNKPKNYPQIAMEAIQEYALYIKRYDTIITGDMNCFKGQSGETKDFSIQRIFETLADMGLTSAYHQQTGQPLGKETTPTFYWRFNERHSYFIDYTFSNIPLKSYSLGKWDHSLSDHVPQFIEI